MYGSRGSALFDPVCFVRSGMDSDRFRRDFGGSLPFFSLLSIQFEESVKIGKEYS